jgi:TonB-linked SusC/RagA family outer membrane protein
MKFNAFNYEHPKNFHAHFKKLLLVMKLMIAIIIFGLTQVYASGKAQTVSLYEKEASLKSIFKKIEKQTGYYFWYDNILLNRAKKITVNLKSVSLEEALNHCFKNQPIIYSLVDKTIVLEERKSDINEQNKLLNTKNALIDRRITGTITDIHQKPLEGVTINVKGTAVVSTSDAKGKYSITLPANGEALTFSMIGFIPQERLIGSATVINIELKEFVAELDNVVIGYGVMKKSDVTGSLSRIKSEEITAFPTTNIVQALSGRATGVQIIQNSGSPGSAISVRIRGTNSIQGSNEPLYVIDGFPISGNPTMLNNADVESIDILKDASATAIYGSRGANGVVLITTKKGSKSGGTRVSYEGNYTVQSMRNKLKLMSPIQYAEFYNEYSKNAGLPPYFSATDLQAFAEMGAGTDWQDLVTQKAPMHNQNLSVEGGNERTQYSIGLGFLGQEGIAINSNFNRYSIKSTLNHQINDKFNTQGSIYLTRTSTLGSTGGNAGRGSTLFSGMLSMPASINPYDDKGNFTVPLVQNPYISNVLTNPLNYLYAQTNQGKANRVLANLAVTYKPFPDLSIRISGGLENTDSRQDDYTTRKFYNSNGSASVSTSQYTSLLNENTATYNKKFGVHSFTLLGGFTMQNFITTTLGASGNTFVSDTQETFNLGAADIFNPSSSSYSKKFLLSYLGRLNYDYDNRYLLTLSFREDGSSVYSPGQKYGFFPSGAIAWRVSNENFMKDISWISDLKLRAGYGATGSQAINPYTTLNLLSTGKTVFGNALFTTYAPGTRLPSNLKWETTYQTDFGLDLALLNNRIQFTADYYVKNTKNLLNTVQLPLSMGYITTLQNIGEMQNKGIELGANIDVLSSESEFKWNLGVNISFNRNKVIKLYNGQEILANNISVGGFSDYINILREGQPLGIFYGYIQDGYTAIGDFKYKDLSGNGTIGTEDRTYIGNPNPKYIYSLNSNFSWKGFELSAYFLGSEGNDIFNATKVGAAVDITQILNLPEEQYLDHWTPQNTNAKYPGAIALKDIRTSNRWVEDGSYLRLKNIQLAYNLKGDQLKLKWPKSAQIYVSGQNLITWTKYSGFDPEVSTYMSENSIMPGIDQFAYPSSKSVTMGVKISM